MTTDEKLDLILKRLDDIEKRLDVIPDAIEVGSMVATTATHEDMTEVSSTLDYISNQFEDFEQRATLSEIRQSLRRVS